MANDPYGYPDAAPRNGGTVSSAMWMGVSALALCSVGMCLLYIPYFVAVPLGALAAWRAYPVMTGAVPADDKDKQMATVGVMSGAVGAFVGGAFSLFALFYFAMVFFYILVVFVAIGAGVMAEPPPAQ